MSCDLGRGCGSLGVEADQADSSLQNTSCLVPLLEPEAPIHLEAVQRSISNLEQLMRLHSGHPSHARANSHKHTR
eukprot:758822-Pleurochrysis_carterae.AAC.1